MTESSDVSIESTSSKTIWWVNKDWTSIKKALIDRMIGCQLKEVQIGQINQMFSKVSFWNGKIILKKETSKNESSLWGQS